MALPKISKRRSEILALGIFLIGLAVISYWQFWWPGIMVVLGITFLVKQYLRGRYYDMFITSFVFGGITLFYGELIEWDLLLPVLFALGGIYIIFREIFFRRYRTGKEETEDVREEIEDARKKH